MVVLAAPFQQSSHQRTHAAGGAQTPPARRRPAGPRTEVQGKETTTRRHTKHRGLTVTNWCFIFASQPGFEIPVSHQIMKANLTVFCYCVKECSLISWHMYLYFCFFGPSSRGSKERRSGANPPATRPHPSLRGAHMRCRGRKRAPRRACAQITRPAHSTQQQCVKMEESNYNEWKNLS